MGRKKGVDRETWWVNKKGYIEGSVFRNGVCRQVKQARWIMEQFLGRPLERWEIPHHKNEIKTDNRIENLEIKEYGRHSTYHNKKRIYKNGYKMHLTEAERKRRSEFMKEVHRRRQENDPTNKWYARTQIQRGNL
ncbi:hypothetical protein LCGC14_2548790 [marine sediment metagenome]|uniref:HNH nuclease domain-containing protein n=1 Tax=marine sediment metagenome TaxID=412755 RepID=A0A0F9BBC1_9ZZZZ